MPWFGESIVASLVSGMPCQDYMESMKALTKPPFFDGRSLHFLSTSLWDPKNMLKWLEERVSLSLQDWLRLVKIGYDWLRLVMHLLKSLSKSSCGSRLRNVFRDLYFYFSHFSLCSSSFVPPIRTKNGEYCDGRITSDVWTWHGYGTGQ